MIGTWDSKEAAENFSARMGAVCTEVQGMGVTKLCKALQPRTSAIRRELPQARRDRQAHPDLGVTLRKKKQDR